MGLEKKEIIDALNTSVKELQQGIDTHCCLLASLKGEAVDGRNLGNLACLRPNGVREQAYKAAIEEAINVIEESRKAFKSKRLEALRKKLTKVLIATQ
jgi:hypothetical protein